MVRTGTLLDGGGLLANRWSTLEVDAFADDRAAVATSLASTKVWAMYLEGLPVAAVGVLREALVAIASFIGVVDVTSDPKTGVLLQNMLPLAFRLVGRELRVLHLTETLVGDIEVYRDRQTRLSMEPTFERVVLEDIGVRDSIFDAGSDPERALRVNETVALATDADHAEAAVLWLDVIDFRLTEALHAATERVASAVSPEQASQAALSCRRFLEQLANALFPPQKDPWKGRDVSTDAWKNRLWAAIESRLEPDNEHELLIQLGTMVDQIKDVSDRGVHRIPPVSGAEVIALVEDLFEWLYQVSALSSPPTRADLGPYSEGIIGTIGGMLDRPSSSAEE